ncbi:DUF6348 family protein [Mitsuaria sp. GD03876]|uniref:DUF6348 family protein n=1 Tax=Mitsuaria sp. GD03876 TaxID=2975399 RepID=UPI002449E8ED|nr:DUF6348 family protein [Mitsuaria sp. GD03876]MDH0863830.1 DUF6348 family protein [Mitsuaria sp. GD03876]
MPSFLLRSLAVLLLGTAAAASHAAAQGADYINAYIDLWLKAHHFEAYRQTPTGIAFNANGAVLDGDIQQVKELKPGSFYSAETRLTLTFKDGRKLEDFVAGAGANPRDAVMDALQNFCLTTLHPVHAAMFDPLDVHVRKARWTIGGKPRPLFLSEWGMRLAKIEPATQQAIESAIAAALKERRLSDDTHWVKLVVAGEQGRMTQVVLTIDGVADDATSNALRAKTWALPKDFFMGKLFFVVGKP